MSSKLRKTLLLALAVGICLNSSGMAMRVCTVTLDTCCEHQVAIDCASDCCEEGETGCCLTILSDEAAMLAPNLEALVALPVSNLEFATLTTRPATGEKAVVLREIPDPPPLSSRERLSRLEIRLI